MSVTLRRKHFTRNCSTRSTDAAERLRYDVVLSAVSDRRPGSRAVRTLLDDRCEAILLLGSQAPESEIVDLAAKVPVVVLARKMPSAHVDVVRTDDEAGRRDGRESSRRTRAPLRSSTSTADAVRAPQERRQGYRKAMRAAGLESRILPGGLTEEFGADAARSMVEQGIPGAVFAFNDRCALGVLDVFLRAGSLGARRRLRDRIRQQCIGRFGAHRSDQCRAGHGVSGVAPRWSESPNASTAEVDSWAGT